MTLTRVQSKADSLAQPTVRSLHVVTFGCQMNKYDSLLVEGRFKREGWQLVGRLADADVVLFNTCSVRDHAEERTFSWLGELKRVKAHNPGLIVGVIGCMAQRVGEQIFARAGHVDLVAGTRQFANLPRLVDEVRTARERNLGTGRKDQASARILRLEFDDDVRVDRRGESSDGGLHAYLTVMRGCDLNCTYCIVPTVRGRVLSTPIEAVVAEARWFVAQGARVITLLGQTVNSYGEDFAVPARGEPHGLGRQGRASLADLLHRLQTIEGLARIRLITLHPSYVTRALALAIAQCDKVDRFLPLPVQSGSDRVLRAMKRGYNLDLYRRRIELLREHVPDIELGSDWIVGFPGESEQEHALSEAFLAEQAFAVNYIFKYDPRPSTSAAEKLCDDVPEEVKKERNRRLLSKAEEVGLRRMSSHVGQRRRAFVEGTAEDGTLLARTIHNLPVRFEGAGELVGRQVELAIESASAFGLGAVLAR